MEKVITEIENLVCDLCFSGLDCAGSDLIKRLERAAALCRELNMTVGEKLCRDTADGLSAGGGRDCAKTLCALACYAESMRNTE